MHLKQTETSKKILIASWTAAITLSLLVVIGTFAEVDVTNLTILAGAAWAELTAAHGFYYWKAKNENRAKGSHKLIRELADQHGLESVTSVLEVIFKE